MPFRDPQPTVSSEPAVTYSGWRALRTIEVRGNLMFTSAFDWDPLPRYGAEAQATCMRHIHTAPNVDCKCGFWAAYDPQTLPEVLKSSVSADGAWLLARVDGFGSVVEHEKGWRAQWQRVLSIVIPDMCAKCGRPTVRLSRRLGDAVLEPLCARHKLFRRRTVGLAAISESLGVETTVGAVPWRHPTTARLWRYNPYTWQ